MAHTELFSEVGQYQPGVAPCFYACEDPRTLLVSVQATADCRGHHPDRFPCILVGRLTCILKILHPIIQNTCYPHRSMRGAPVSCCRLHPSGYYFPSLGPGV